MVNTAPHFGHFTFVSLATYPAHPKVITAANATTEIKLTSFFTPLHLLSFINSLLPKIFRKSPFA
jgi:type II restriction/modification system DNA methylase subunit YeeA